MTDPIRAALERLVAADEFIGEAGPEYQRARDAARAALASDGPASDFRRWSEGVCGDGAAILRDGVMMPIEEIVAELNRRPAPAPTHAPPVSEEVGELVGWLHGQDGGIERRAIYSRIADLLKQQQGRIAEIEAEQMRLKPVPVGEGLPQPKDCLDEGWAWFFNSRVGWRQMIMPVSAAYTHWLPARALPIPTTSPAGQEGADG